MSSTSGQPSSFPWKGTRNKRGVGSSSSAPASTSNVRKSPTKPKISPSSVANNNYQSDSAPSKQNVRGKSPSGKSNSSSPARQQNDSQPKNKTEKPQNVKNKTSALLTTLVQPKASMKSSYASSRASRAPSFTSLKSLPLVHDSNGVPNSAHVIKRNRTQNTSKTKTGSVYLERPSTGQSLAGSSRGFPFSISYTKYPNNVISRSLASVERSKSFRALVERAIKEKKIFSCVGVYPAIRKALKKRGWVEKPKNLFYTHSVNGVSSLARNEAESDVIWLARMLKNYSPDFLWVIRRDHIDWKLPKEQLINRFPRAYFTTKVGLAACLPQMDWYCEAGLSGTFLPRCYRLCLEDERQAFQDDYRLTACMSYLRYFVNKYEKRGHKSIASVPGSQSVPAYSLDFAIRQLGTYIRSRRHEDIDWLLQPNIGNHYWELFIQQFYAVVHNKMKIHFESPEASKQRYEAAAKLLKVALPYWPQAQLDGTYNMWICKPGARSRGIGIRIMNNLEKILELLSHRNFRDFNWVVQKYIEKPLLIYKTKFDIRQWFLVLNWAPLTVWFYKESYVRFCSKPFVLENFHESIHLCNNAIQQRYRNSAKRDSNLPKENMWSSDSFQTYLKSIGKEDAWPQIYSKMKQAIVGVMLASQQDVTNKQGCYELYGADFMLTEDYQPWLIEINSCPCMAASTSVTARMCAQCLEDTIKVVVDRRTNQNADTGKFELIYRQSAGSVPVKHFNGQDLTVVGQKLSRNIEWPAMMSGWSRPPSRQPKSLTSVSQQLGISRSSLLNNNTESNKSLSISPAKKQTLFELIQKLRVRSQIQASGSKSKKNSESKKEKNQQNE